MKREEFPFPANRLPLIWCAGVAVGAVVSAWLAAPLALTLLLAVTLLIPGAASIAARTHTRRHVSSRAGGGPGRLQRLAFQHEAALWALGLASAASITGGVVSPLCGLFVLIPVLFAVERDRQRTVDAAILSLIGYGTLVVVERAMDLPALPPWAWPLGVFPVLAAMVWVLATAFALPKPSADAPILSGGTEEKGVPAGAALTALASLPRDGPVSVMDVSALGRIQSIAGNLDLLPMARPGLPVEQLVAPPGRTAFRQRLRQGGDLRLAIGKGAARRLYIRPHRRGVVLFVVPAEGEVRAAEAARTAAANRHDAALKDRNLYFASLSHDLKTPLNAILGFADIMRAQLKGPMPEAYRDYAGIIHESGEDLMLLVEDILDLAKADAGRQSLDIEPIDLGASGRSVLRQFEPQAERRGVQLSLNAEPDAWAMADARAVRQIWQNLLSNAIKYSRRGQTVQASAMRVGSQVELRVDDEGEGMDEADLKAVAQPFAQGRNATGRSGTGLGLTVVNQFADLMGGQVIMTSAKGRGTRVRVTFSRAHPSDYAALEDAAE